MSVQEDAGAQPKQTAGAVPKPADAQPRFIDPAAGGAATAAGAAAGLPLSISSKGAISPDAAACECHLTQQQMI